jgi:hypothetical protein
MIFTLIHIAIIVVVGAILFYVIDKFVRDGRLGCGYKLLKLVRGGRHLPPDLGERQAGAVTANV